MNFPTSQTPPPPSPYMQPAPPPPGPTGPGLSEPQRLMNVFIAPTKTFEDLKRNPSWWVPWLLAAVFTLVFAVVAVQKMDMTHFVQQQIDHSKLAQRQMEQLTPEQRARNIELRATISKVVFYLTPLISFLAGLIIAAILMAIFNFLLGAEVTFPRALGVVFYAGLPGILFSILLIVSFLVSADPSTIDINSNPMPTNPAFFMDPEGNKVLYSLASALDIFKIWWVTLLGLGFTAASTNRKPTRQNGLITAFVAYGVVVLIGMGFKVMFG